jgi:hypothetical protein
MESLGMENFGIFCDHLEYFTAIGYNLWPFCIVCGHLVYFSQFGMFGPRKIWQRCFKVQIVVHITNNNHIIRIVYFWMEICPKIEYKNLP